MAPKYLSKLQGQRVLVLGGTSGIGFCVAEAALEFGAIVIISGSTQSKIDAKIGELKESYPDAGERILGKRCDISDAQQQESNIVALLDYATEDKTKKLDHIIVTAHDGLNNPSFSELTVDIIQKAQIVRVVAPLMIAKHSETYVHKSASSSITFTSGSSIYKPPRGWTLLPVVGAALEGLVRSLAVNIAPIRVNGVAPGPVMTELWGGGQKVPEEKAKTIAENFSKKLLTGRVGMPEDAAESYLYVMRNHFVTGIMHLSEGGTLLKEQS